MKFQKRDWYFVAIIVVVLGIFIVISGKEKTKLVPLDADHQKFHDMIKAGKSKKEVDPLCEACHDGVKIAFPKDHPAKPGGQPMRCLFCHKIKR
jgi:hypothetical protein